jgi:hypothetical protein
MRTLKIAVATAAVTLATAAVAYAGVNAVSGQSSPAQTAAAHRTQARATYTLRLDRHANRASAPSVKATTLRKHERHVVRQKVTQRSATGVAAQTQSRVQTRQATQTAANAVSRDQTCDQTRQQTRDQARDQTCDQTRDQARDQTCDQTQQQSRDQTRERARDGSCVGGDTE